MKRFAITALLSVVTTFEAHAQYGPPARDLQEAQRLMGEHFRQVQPAFDHVREQSAVLIVLTKAHNQLIEAPSPSQAIDMALKTINDFLEKLEAENRPLSRENMRDVTRMRAEIETVKLGPIPADLKPLRDRLHHETIHPLQRTAVLNAQRMQQLMETYRRISEQLVREAWQEVLTAAGSAAHDPK